MPKSTDNFGFNVGSDAASGTKASNDDDPRSPQGHAACLTSKTHTRCKIGCAFVSLTLAIFLITTVALVIAPMLAWEPPCVVGGECMDDGLYAEAGGRTAASGGYRRDRRQYGVSESERCGREGLFAENRHSSEAGSEAGGWGDFSCSDVLTSEYTLHQNQNCVTSGVQDGPDDQSLTQCEDRCEMDCEAFSLSHSGATGRCYLHTSSCVLSSSENYAHLYNTYVKNEVIVQQAYWATFPPAVGTSADSAASVLAANTASIPPESCPVVECTAAIPDEKNDQALIKPDCEGDQLELHKTLGDYGVIVVIFFVLATIIELAVYVARVYLNWTGVGVKGFLREKAPMLFEIPVLGPYVSAPTIAIMLRLFFMGFQIPILALELHKCCCAVSTIGFMDTSIVIGAFNFIMITFVSGGLYLAFGIWWKKRQEKKIKRNEDGTEKLSDEDLESAEKYLKWAGYVRTLGLGLLVISFTLSFVSGIVIMFGGIATIDGDTFSGEPNFNGVSSLVTLFVLLVQIICFIFRFD